MMNHTDSRTAKGRGATPPYIPFRTFKTFLQDLDEHGIPGRVDNTALKRFSGGVARQLKTALRFLDLINGEDRPTDNLRALSDAFDGEQWQAALADLLRRHYSPALTTIDLAQATPGELREAFKQGFGASTNEDVLRKTELFFLQAAQEAGLPISKRIPVVTRQRSPSGSNSRRRAAPKSAPPPKDEKPEERRQGHERLAQQPYEMLIKILDLSKMEEEEIAAVWTLIRYLKRKEAEE